MKEVKASINIQAGAACVWRALIDFKSYREWLPDAPRIIGTLEEGGSLELLSELPGAASRTHTLLLRKVEVERELCWSLTTFGAKFFGSERRFVIKPIDTGKVEFAQSEVFCSAVSALSAFASYSNIRQAMEQMNLALKGRAEQLEKQLSAETMDLTV